jgi:HEAT repeat protein
MSISIGRAVMVMAGLLALAVILSAVLLLSPTKAHRAEGLVAMIRTASLTGDNAAGEVAYERLKKVGPAAVPVASRLLRDQDPRARALGAELVQELVEEIRERNEDGYTPMEVRETVPLLIGVLEDEDEDVRSEAASALGWIGPDAVVAIRPLEQALKDPSKEVREKAARALRRIQGQSAP